MFDVNLQYVHHKNMFADWMKCVQSSRYWCHSLDLDFVSPYYINIQTYNIYEPYVFPFQVHPFYTL